MRPEPELSEGVAHGPYLWNDRRGMQRVTLKTSTIFIAKGGATRVYRSVAEIPHDLRRQLEDCTNGFNSATILIADRRGREEIRRALNGMPSTLRTRLASSLNPEDRAAETPAVSEELENNSPFALSDLLRRHWMKLMLPVAGLLAWVAAQYR